MPTLPTNRTVDTPVEDHLTDHNDSLHELFNVISGSGADGQLLTRNSGQPLEVEWANFGGQNDILFTPDSLPDSPNAKDYEFNETTTSLPAGWSWVNQGTATYREEFGWGIISFPAAGSTDIKGIVQSAPVGPFTITCKLAFANNLTGASHFGPMVRSSSTAEMMFFMLDNALDIRSTNYLGPFGPVSVDTLWIQNWADFSSPYYFRMERIDEDNWNFSISPNGAAWYTNLLSFNLNPFDQIGWGFNTASNHVGEASCDWFRVT